MKFRLVLKAKPADGRADVPERPKLRIGGRRAEGSDEDPETDEETADDENDDGDDAGDREEHRYATLHTDGPDSPGHAVRLVRHAEKPGSWRVHPEDRKRAMAALRSKPSTRPENASARRPRG